MDSRENDCSPVQLCRSPGRSFFNTSDNWYKKVWVSIPCVFKAQSEEIFLAENLANLANLANVLKFVLLLPLAPQFANLSQSLTSSALLSHWTLKVTFLLIIYERSSRISFCIDILRGGQKIAYFRCSYAKGGILTLAIHFYWCLVYWIDSSSLGLNYLPEWPSHLPQWCTPDFKNKQKYCNLMFLFHNIGIASKLCPHLAVNMTQCPEDVWVSGGKAIWQWAMSQRPLEVSSIDNKRHPLNGCGDIRVLKAVVQSHHMVWSGSLPRLQPTPSTRPHVDN